MNEAKLKAIMKNFARAGKINTPHVINPIAAELPYSKDYRSERGDDGWYSLDWWKAQDCPFVWHTVERIDSFSVAIDTARGWMALFERDALTDVGLHSLTSEDAVALDRDYYGLHKYIWL